MDAAQPESATTSRGEQTLETGRGLSRSTTLALRRVLHAYREGWVLDSRFEAVAGMIAEDAWMSGLSAERMLVVLKRWWDRLDDMKDLPVRERRELLDRIVTLYIEAYYAAKPRAAGAPAKAQGNDARSD